MMLRVLIAAALIVAALTFVKDQRVLQRSGLLGYCTSYAPAGSGEWRACHTGKLSGAPDLTRSSCTVGRHVGSVDYWRCPAKVDAGIPG